jgi:DNA-binding response OmpR family regulator
MTASKLLIVDDEPLTVEMLSTFLEINGYTCAGAYSGTDGLLLLQTEKPDLMILDLMMPDMEGYEVCEKVRNNTEFAKTPVLIMSARTDPESIEKAYKSGANAYMTKPPDLMALLTEIARLATPAAS